MLSLPELEQAFADGMFDENGAKLLAHVAPGRFGAERHLQVYRNNIFTSLTEALRAVYPVVTRLVGEGFLKYAAHEFIRRYPPMSGNLHDFGSEFADFLAGFAPAKDLVYLPDVALLEWAYHEVFHAADPLSADIGGLRHVAPEAYGQLRFSLHASARLLASAYPVLHIWQVNQSDYNGGSTVKLSEGGVKLLVKRKGIAVEFENLSEAAYDFLSACAKGSTFAQASSAALATEPGFDLAQTLRQYFLPGTLICRSHH